MAKCYDPESESLVFEEKEIVFYLNDFESYEMNGAVIIRHTKKHGKKDNCYRSDHQYLQEIFRQYLLYCRQGGKRSQNDENQASHVEHHRDGMIVLAQLQTEASMTCIQKRIVPYVNFPTYGVAFEFELESNPNTVGAESVVEIVCRGILRQSFLPVALKTLHHPVIDGSHRHCLILESNPDYHSGWQESMFMMQPYCGPLASLTNEYQQPVVNLLGVGSASVNLTFLQAMLS